MTGKGLLLLAALGGGAVYLYSKKEKGCGPGMHRMPDGSCMRNELMPSGTYDVLDPEMVALYQTIIYGHGTPNDCKTLLEYIDHLTPENDAEEAWVAQVRSDVVQACEAGPVPVASDPPVLPSWIPDGLVATYNDCWNNIDPVNCHPNALAGRMINIINNYAGTVPPSQIQQVYDAMRELTDRYVAVSGVHVGDCGCSSCALKNVGHEEDEPCCEACAMKGVGACSCQMPNNGATAPAAYQAYPSPMHYPPPEEPRVDYGSVRGT